eukprot:3525192-Prymnesium_polylepis.2
MAPPVAPSALHPPHCALVARPPRVAPLRHSPTTRGTLLPPEVPAPLTGGRSHVAASEAVELGRGVT